MEQEFLFEAVGTLKLFLSSKFLRILMSVLGKEKSVVCVGRRAGTVFEDHKGPCFHDLLFSFNFTQKLEQELGLRCG